MNTALVGALGALTRGMVCPVVVMGDFQVEAEVLAESELIQGAGLRVVSDLGPTCFLGRHVSGIDHVLLSGLVVEGMVSSVCTWPGVRKPHWGLQVVLNSRPRKYGHGD